MWTRLRTCVDRVLPRHERGPSGRADGRYVVVVEDEARVRQGVEVRGRDLGRPVEAHVVPALQGENQIISRWLPGVFSVAGGSLHTRSSARTKTMCGLSLVIGMGLERRSLLAALGLPVVEVVYSEATDADVEDAEVMGAGDVDSEDLDAAVMDAEVDGRSEGAPGTETVLKAEAVEASTATVINAT